MQLYEFIKWHLFKLKSTENISLNWVGRFPILKKLFGRIIFPVIERLRTKGSHHYRHQVLCLETGSGLHKNGTWKNARVKLDWEFKWREESSPKEYVHSDSLFLTIITMATTKTKRINFTIHAKTINDDNNNNNGDDNNNYNDDEMAKEWDEREFGR